MAKIVSLAYVMVGSRLEGVVERRRYGLNLGHRNIKCDLTRSELFQLCLFDQTELAEKKEEDDFLAQGFRFDHNRLALRYVKFIVRNIFDAATFNVAMAISRQLFGLDWASSEWILSSVVHNDQGQTHGDRVLRRLVQKLKFRFHDITEMGSDGRGHQYFHYQPVTHALGKTIHMSLRLVTPWGSSHVVPRTFRRGDALDGVFNGRQRRLSRAARIGGEGQAMTDRNRRHTFIDLKCFARLAEASGIRNLLSKVCVPRFAIARDSDAGSGPRSLLRFRNEPPSEYWEVLFAEIAKREGMKARFTGDRLVVRVDSHDVGYLIGKGTAKLNFEITEDESIVSIVGFQEGEEIPLVTLFPRSDGFFDLRRGQHWQGRTRHGDARIGLRITQLGRIVDGDRAVSVDVNYEKGLTIAGWAKFHVPSLRRISPWQVVAASIVVAICFSAYSFLVNPPQAPTSPLPIVNSDVARNQIPILTEISGSSRQPSSENSMNQRSPSMIVPGKQVRQVSLNNRNFPDPLSLYPEVSKDLANEMRVSGKAPAATGDFEPIAKDKDADFKTNEEQPTVDANLRVGEGGRRHTSFNGGLSGIGGSFYGLEYSTNSLVGRGEMLSPNLAAGNRQRSFQFLFTGPYIQNRPISARFSLLDYARKFFDKRVFISPVDLLNVGEENVFTRTSSGASVYVSAPLSEFYRRRPSTQFSRVGLSYLSMSSVSEDPYNPTQFMPAIYRQPVVNGRATASFYTTRNASVDFPTDREIRLQMALAGLSDDVRTYQPTISYTQFFPVRRRRSERPEVFGFRITAGTVGSFATAAKRRSAESVVFVDGVPFFERFFLVDEFSIRGYNLRSMSPPGPLDTFITLYHPVMVLSSFGTPTVVPGVPPSVAKSLIPIGADTQLLGNFEYRVPITGSTERLAVVPRSIGMPTVVPGVPSNVAKSLNPMGADTQLLGNFEYRVPIIGSTERLAGDTKGGVSRVEKQIAQSVGLKDLDEYPNKPSRSTCARW